MHFCLSFSRVPGMNLQSPTPWSSAASITGASTVQVPMLQAKSQAEGIVANPLGVMTPASIFQHTLRPVGHLGTQQMSPLAIRAQPQKVLLSGPLTSLAPASMGHAGTAAGAVVATVTRVTGEGIGWLRLGQCTGLYAVDGDLRTERLAG